MKLWNLCISGAIVLTIGFGAGYYAKTVSHSKAEEQYKISESTEKPSSSPIPSPTVSPAAMEELPAEAEANAPGEAYITQSEGDGTSGQNQYYMLKEYQGKIAIYKVYQTGQTTLMSIIDVGVESLPESDRKSLGVGIGVTSEEEMLQLIEDYTS